MKRKWFTEKELEEYAEIHSRRIEIRTYNGGNSRDFVRESTPEEKRIIKSLIYGALLSINSGSDAQSAKDTAEYTGNLLMNGVVGDGKMNGYGTIYLPIANFDFSHTDKL